MNKIIVVPTYKVLRREKLRFHIWVIAGLMFMAYGTFLQDALVIIIWGGVVLLDIYNLTRIDKKIKLRDLLKENYETKNNVKLSRDEFDKLFSQDSNDEKEQG